MLVRPCGRWKEPTGTRRSGPLCPPHVPPKTLASPQNHAAVEPSLRIISIHGFYTKLRVTCPARPAIKRNPAANRPHSGIQLHSPSGRAVAACARTSPTLDRQASTWTPSWQPIPAVWTASGSPCMRNLAQHVRRGQQLSEISLRTDRIQAYDRTRRIHQHVTEARRPRSEPIHHPPQGHLPSPASGDAEWRYRERPREESQSLPLHRRNRQSNRAVGAQGSARRGRATRPPWTPSRQPDSAVWAGFRLQPAIHRSRAGSATGTRPMGGNGQVSLRCALTPDALLLPSMRHRGECRSHGL